MHVASAIRQIKSRYRSLAPLMDERLRRQWAAMEAQAYGWGGLSAASDATGMSRNTIRKGMVEWEVRKKKPRAVVQARLRRPGGGRKCLTEPDEVAKLLKAIYGYQGSPIVLATLKLSALLFVRPDELRHARWEDISLSKAEWRYVTSKTKTPHIVPLAKQAIEILPERRHPFQAHVPLEQAQSVWPHTERSAILASCLQEFETNSALRPDRPYPWVGLDTGVRPADRPRFRGCGSGCHYGGRATRVRTRPDSFEVRREQ